MVNEDYLLISTNNQQTLLTFHCNLYEIFHTNYNPPNKTSQISFVEFFLAKSLAFIFMVCNFPSEFKISYNDFSILASFFIQIATPFFSKYSAFSTS